MACTKHFRSQNMVDTLTRQVNLYQFSYVPSTGISRHRLWDSNTNGEIGGCSCCLGDVGGGASDFSSPRRINRHCSPAVYCDPRGLFTACATPSTLSNIRPARIKRTISAHSTEECERRGIQQYCQRCRAGVGDEDIMNDFDDGNGGKRTDAEIELMRNQESAFLRAALSGVSSRFSRPAGVLAPAHASLPAAHFSSSSSGGGNGDQDGSSTTSVGGEKRSRIDALSAAAFALSQTPAVLQQTPSEICGDKFRLGPQHGRVFMDEHRRSAVRNHFSATSASLASRGADLIMVPPDRAPILWTRGADVTESQCADAAADCKMLRPATSATSSVSHTSGSFYERMTAPLSMSSLAPLTVFLAPDGFTSVVGSPSGDARACRYPVTQSELFQNFQWTSRIKLQ
jgi:hypothetical protein